MKKLAYINTDGFLSIVIPARKEDIESTLATLLTNEDYRKLIYDQSIPSDVDPETIIEIEDDNIPEDREFRGAWKLNGNVIDFDLDKAKDIQLENIRKAREPRLKELDQAFMQALELPNGATMAEDAQRNKAIAAIAQEKQSLRDITEPLKALEPTSIDEIKEAFPEELKDGE